MEQADVAAVIEELARLIAVHYVFPDVGEELGSLLARRTAEGRYRGATDEADLAALVTEDLQSVNGDKHLRSSPRPTPSSSMFAGAWAATPA